MSGMDVWETIAVGFAAEAGAQREEKPLQQALHRETF
jgi:hypothetical protein